MLRLRYWRKKKHLTLKQLQALTGIPYQTLSQYEIDDVQPPFERLQRIADALQIPIGALFVRRSKTSNKETVSV